MIILPAALAGQSLQLNEIAETDQILLASLAKTGILYTYTLQGNLTAFDKDGKIQSQSSLLQGRQIDKLEAHIGLQIMLFSEQDQVIYRLDRFLKPIKELALPQNQFQYVTMVSQSHDGDYWIWDEAAYQLVKWGDQGVQFEIPLNQLFLDQTADPVWMKEYKNHLYLCRGGIMYLFDNMGNYLGKWTETIKPPFDFDQDRIYFLKNNQLSFLAFDNGRVIQREPIQGSIQPQMALIKREEGYIIGHSKIYTFRR